VYRALLDSSYEESLPERRDGFWQIGDCYETKIRIRACCLPSPNFDGVRERNFAVKYYESEHVSFLLGQPRCAF